MNFKGYRTVFFNLVMIIAHMVTMVSGIDVTEEATQMQEGFLLLLAGLDLVWAIGNVWLRYITDTPIFSSEVSYHYKKSRK